MERITHVALGVLLVVVTVGGSGCGLQRLKDSNRRLKESNDRLISENNRLEGNLAAAQQRIQELEVAPPIQVATPVAPMDPTLDTLTDADLLGLPSDITVTSTAEGIRFTMPDKVFFALGQAELTSKGRSTLDHVVRLLRDQYPGRMVRVDGHTDDTPVRKVKFKYPSNWELSSARACSVVRYLVGQKGVDPQRVFAAGFGEFQPVATRSAKSQNRRVEITVLNATAI